MIEQILFYVGAGFFLVILLILIFLNIRKSIKNKQSVNTENIEDETENSVVIQDNVRYTQSSEIKKENGKANITFNNSDIILNMNKTYIVGLRNKVIPGKYTLLSVTDEKTTFGLKINGIVSSFSHGCNMVFADGDVISPTTQNIILR